MHIKKFILSAIFCSFSAKSAQFLPNSTYQTCFVPPENCAGLVAKAIDHASSTIDVQAYHLTNKVIIAALARAKARGVSVRLILDRQARKEAERLLINDFQVLYDPRSIAHNKVMIFDNMSIITGSFNFTENAQSRNVENLIWIKDSAVANLYHHNFTSRYTVSK